MNIYKGTIIEESLLDKGVLKEVKILSTKVEKITEEHETPWLEQWTLHSVEIPEEKGKEIAEKISRALDPDHGGSWYADFKNATRHYIIFLNRIFSIDRQNKEQYDEAKEYGLSLGIPESQLINYQGGYNDDV